MFKPKFNIILFFVGLFLLIDVIYLFSTINDIFSEQGSIFLCALVMSIILMMTGIADVMLWIIKKVKTEEQEKKELINLENEIKQIRDIRDYEIALRIKEYSDKYSFRLSVILLLFMSFMLYFLLTIGFISLRENNISLLQDFKQNYPFYFIIILTAYVTFVLIRLIFFIDTQKYKEQEKNRKIVSDYENQQANLINIINYLNITTGFSHHSLKNASVIIDGMIKNIEVGDVIKEEDKRDLILGVDNLWRAIEDFNTFGKPKGEVNYPIETLINAIHLLHKVKTKKFEFAIIYQNIDKTTKLNVEWHDAYQMIDNLLINAYDAVATTEIKKVSLIISPSKDNFVSIIVADTGEGIPKYYQDKLFVLGFTTKTTPNIKRGTGLTHIKYLAEKNNGTVAYKTTNQEYSTIFELLLPISK